MKKQIEEYIKVEGEKLASKVLDCLKESTELYINYHLPIGTEHKIIEEAAFLLTKAGWKCQAEGYSINIWVEETV